MEGAQGLVLGARAMQGEVFTDQRDDIDRVFDGGFGGFGIAGHRGLLGWTQARVLGVRGPRGVDASSLPSPHTVPSSMAATGELYLRHEFGQVFRAPCRGRPSFSKLAQF